MIQAAKQSEHGPEQPLAGDGKPGNKQNGKRQAGDGVGVTTKDGIDGVPTVKLAQGEQVDTGDEQSQPGSEQDGV